MKFKFAIITGSLTIFSSFGIAAPQGYFNPSEFGACLARAINTAGGASYLSNRKADAAKIRQGLDDKSKFLQSGSKLNFLERQIFEESTLASIPFVGSSLLNSAPSEQLPLSSLLFSQYQVQDSKNPVDRDNLSQTVSTLADASKNLKVPDPGDLFLTDVYKTMNLANPLVIWLLSHKKQSVSHWELLSYATNVYNGDVLAALGVIGELFYQETLQSSPERNAKAVLGSKMKKLVVSEEVNQVGHNYHFWRIITASLNKGGTLMGRLYGYIDNNDEAYRFANKQGLEAASAALTGIGKPHVDCRLQ